MGVFIGLISGTIAAYLGPKIVTKQRDKALLGLLQFLKRSVILTFILVVVIAPMGEELLFRYLGFKIVDNFLSGIVWKLAITSLIFGLAHKQSPHNLLAGLFGLVLGWAYYQYGLLQSIMAHATHNFVVVLHLFYSFQKCVGKSLIETLTLMSPVEVVDLYEESLKTRR